MTDYIATISIGNTNKSLSLEDYQGKLSLVSTWEGKDGKVRANWCFRQERVNGENVPGKAEAVKLPLGDKVSAVAILTQLINALSPPAQQPAGKPGDEPVYPGRFLDKSPDEDLPF